MADRRLQIFAAVAKHGSFTRAAEHLFMTQPAVTFQIKQLEEEFSARLLDRGHGRVSLTPAGKIVHDYAERILDLSEEMETRVAELTDDLAGPINIGTSMTIAGYWLPMVLDEFKQKYPDVIPRVVVGNSLSTEERVSTRELDLGFIEISADQPNVRRLTAARDELMLICAPNHPLAALESVKPEDLLPHSLINRDEGNSVRDLTEKWCKAGGVNVSELKISAELGSLDSVKQLVIRNMGYALASRAAIQHELREGSLAAVHLSPPLFNSLEVILPKDKFYSRLVQTFADDAVECLTRRAAEIARNLR
ncbi:MAG TPA: LysR family transcriptional regulator [Azoarcus sp.]|nr:LysR family transcriptional regulator [Azoarcus sp.]